MGYGAEVTDKFTGGVNGSVQKDDGGCHYQIPCAGHERGVKNSADRTTEVGVLRELMPEPYGYRLVGDRRLQLLCGIQQVFSRLAGNGFMVPPGFKRRQKRADSL